MLSSALVAFIHHLAAFALLGSLVAERVLFSATPTLAQARRLRTFDRVYGASAGVLLLAGLARVLWLEKGAAFYFGNPFFVAKLALFVAVGLASIRPTLLFASWRRTLQAGQAPVVPPDQALHVRRLVDLQLTGVAAIVLCAALMAKGVGF